MSQSSMNGNSLAGVQDQHVLQKVFQLSNFPHLFLWKALITYQICEQVLGGIQSRQNWHLILQREKRLEENQDENITGQQRKYANEWAFHGTSAMAASGVWGDDEYFSGVVGFSTPFR